MVEQLKRDWVAWLLTLGAVITLAGPLGMLRELGQSFGGYITFQRSTSMLPEIDLNTPAWWSGIINNRAGHGDTLVSVNGRPHATEARSAYAEAAQNGQTSAALAVIPDNESETRTVQVPINTFSLGYFFDVRMPDLITGFVLWASALIVYLARPNEPANRTFALAAATVGYTRILYVHTVFFDSAYATTVEIWLSILLAFNGAVTYHFAMSFPQPIQRKAVRFSIILVYLLGVMTAIGLVTSRIPSLSPEYRSTAYWTGYYLSIILLLVGVVALVSRLLWMRFSPSSSKRDRRISSILVMGLLISMPAILVSGFNALDWSPSLPSYFWKGLDLRFLLLAIPLTFAFVFTRYQAMHSPSRVFIILIGLSSSALTAAIGSWLWTLSYPMWQDSGLRPPFMVLFITALATTLFWSIAARWRSMLGRDLNWSGYSNTTLRAFGRRIVTTEENEIPQSIVDALVSEFELDQAAIWVYQPNDSTLRLAAQSGTQQTPLPSLMTITESYPEDQFRPFRANELASVTAEWAQSLVASGGVELYLPLISGGQVQGLLGLGSRWDEDVFDDRDLETAELVSQQAALFLAAARYIRELKRVPDAWPMSRSGTPTIGSRIT
ncbi:MAG: GAF domain-containing protein [Chloroflexota bacterium]